MFVVFVAWATSSAGTTNNKMMKRGRPCTLPNKNNNKISKKMNIVPISPNFKEAELKPNQKKNTASLHFTHFMASTANCTPRRETHTLQGTGGGGTSWPAQLITPHSQSHIGWEGERWKIYNLLVYRWLTSFDEGCTHQGSPLVLVGWCQ